MKKRIIVLALAALALFTLAGCRAETGMEDTDGPAIEPAISEANESPAVSQPDETDDIPSVEQVTCRVKVLPNNWNWLLVTDWGEADHPVGLCTVSVQNAWLTGADGEAVTLDGLRPGMILDITWDGLIAESFPGGLIADEVRVVEQGDDLVGLYRQVLARLWTETGQKTGVEWLGFDFSGLTGLTPGEQAALAYLSACELEMGFSYSPGNWDELAENGFITMDEDGYWTDGMMLSLSIYDQGEGHVGFVASSRRARDGAILVLTCLADRQEEGSWGYDAVEPSGT